MLKDALFIIGGLIFLVAAAILAYFWFFQDYIIKKPINLPTNAFYFFAGRSDFFSRGDDFFFAERSGIY